MFSEGSDRRRSFISNLAALLVISERQIVVVSVRSGSIIVELAFVRDAASSVSPSDCVSRLKDAAAAGKLEPLGVSGLSIGGQPVAISSSSAELSFGIIVGIAGSCAIVTIVHAIAFVKSKNLKAADSKVWIITSLLCGPMVWLFWRLFVRLNKVFPDRQKPHFSTHLANAALGSQALVPDDCINLKSLANRVLDFDNDNFEMRSPIDGLDQQPLLPFKTITEADPFVKKFPTAAKFAQIAAKAGKHKLHHLGAKAHGLTADEIAMIHLCVIRVHFLSKSTSETLCEQLHNGKPILSRHERISSRPQPRRA
jgi:hypothetical protein